MADWYYTVGDERLGPVSGSQLRQLATAGTVTPHTLVWTEGAADWAPAAKVKGLFPAVAPGLVAAAVGDQGHLAAGGTLRYASAGTIAETAAPAPFAPPPPDDGPFHRLGRNFRVGKQRWVGKAIVSPRAIYLWKVSRPNAGAYGMGGLVGVALAVAAAKADDLTRSCDITELPDAVRRQLDPKLKRTKGDVVILNRDALSLVKTSRWTNSVTPFVGAERFPITCGMFGLGKGRAFMRDHGWTLDLTVQPTAAPTHARGYGLDEETVRRRTHKSLWVRIGSALLAVVVFVAYVCFRVWLATKHR